MENTKQDENTNAALTLWVDDYSDDLLSWAFYKTSNMENAEDLVQDTFIAACRGIEKYEGKSNPKTWLFSILNNKLIDYHRKKFKNIFTNISDFNSDSDNDYFDKFFDANDDWKTGIQPDTEFEIENKLSNNDQFLDTLNKCIGELPELWNSAVQLKYLEEKKGKLICQELDITPSNYWQILHRAKLQLRSCLENNWFKD
jgi:RNA polymerase sigma-70 factor (TIGR02943 family)